MNNIAESTQRILACGLVPIIRGNFAKSQVLRIAQILNKHGISILEITLNSSNALQLIAMLRAEYGDAMFIGAGTVRSLPLFKQARDAGARFTIAPNFDAATVAASISEDFLHLPGVLTPSEIQQAAAAGCSIVKLFPVDCLGPKYLRAVRAPLDDMLLLPTGGVTLENLEAYVDAGAAGVGIGSALVRGSSQTPEELEHCAAAFRRGWDAAVALRKE